MACMSSSSLGDTSPRILIMSAARFPIRDEIISSVPGNYRHDFVSVSKLSQTLQTAARKLRSMASKQQFVLFGNVKHFDLDAFDRIPDHRSYRVSYFEEILIVRIMPGVKHEESGRCFYDLIRGKVREMGLPKSCLRATGTATVRGTGGAGKKQPDESFVPTGTREGDMEDVPSLVIEIGVSESRQQLRNDAKWWLLNTNWGTRYVVLLHIDVAAQAIHIETWNMPVGSNQQGSGGRSTRAERAFARAQRASGRPLEPCMSFELDITLEQGQRQLSHHNPLEIPWFCVWDRYPEGQARNIIISDADFIDFADEVWLK